MSLTVYSRVNYMNLIMKKVVNIEGVQTLNKNE